MGDRADLLVIDEDPAFRRRLCVSLQEAGYSVVDAGDGDDGLSKTRDHRPEFVLCDWLAERIDGAEYCRRVKSDPELSDTYVTLLTSSSEADWTDQAGAAGADDFVAKTASREELLARVRGGLLRRQSERARVAEAGVQRARSAGQEMNNALTGLLGHLSLARQYLDRDEEVQTKYHLDRGSEVIGRIAEIAQRLCALR